MDVLGHEIDCSFVYQITPIRYITHRTDAFQCYFELMFKDGRSHIVKISFNYDTARYRGDVLLLTHKTLTKAELKSVPGKLKEAIKTIKKLRSDISKSMLNPPILLR